MASSPVVPSDDKPESHSAATHPYTGFDPLKDPGIPVVEIKDIPGKGKGVVACYDLPAGTRIVSEKPLLMVEFPVDEQVIATQLAALPIDKQRQFLSLSNHFAELPPLSGTVETNALPCGNRESTGGIFPVACHFSHSCLPNAQCVWNSDTEEETTHAIRPINAGDEITISYVHWGSSADRQAELQESFGFQCTCPICSLPPYEKKKSDDRRLLIDRLRRRTADGVFNMDDPKVKLAECQILLRTLMREFRGHPGAFSAHAYVTAFRICIARGDQARASVFAHRAYKILVECQGEDSPGTKWMKSLSVQPADHSAYELVSSEWKTSMDEIAEGMDPDQFDIWLFRQMSPVGL